MFDERSRDASADRQAGGHGARGLRRGHRAARHGGEVAVRLNDYDEPDGTMFENCNSSCVIYTDAPSQPSGWITGWNYMMMGSASTALTVKWGSTHEEFLAA